MWLVLWAALGVAADSEVQLGGAFWTREGEVRFEPWLHARIRLADRMHLLPLAVLHMEPRRGEDLDIALFGGAAGFSGGSGQRWIDVLGVVGVQLTPHWGSWRIPVGIVHSWASPFDLELAQFTLRVAPTLQVGRVELCLGMGVTADPWTEGVTLRLGTTGQTSLHAPTWDRGIPRPTFGFHLSDHVLGGLSVGLTAPDGRAWTPSAGAGLGVEF